MNSFKHSLIIATRGTNFVDLEKCVESILEQKDISREIIIVANNNVNKIKNEFLEKYKKDFGNNLRFKVFSNVDGTTSYSRNIGINNASGEIISFPDDDSILPPNLLNRANIFFNKNKKYEVLLGRFTEKGDEENFSSFLKQACVVNEDRALNGTVTAVCMFFKKYVLEAINGFDEEIGPGPKTKIPAGEEMDLVIRALKSNAKIFYDPSFITWHPRKNPEDFSEEDMLKRFKSYSFGIGRVLQKNNCALKQKFLYLFRPFTMTFVRIFFLQIKKSKYHWYTFRGRWDGIFYNEKNKTF